MNDTAVQVSNPTTQGDINQAVSLVVQDKLEKAGITDQTLSELKSELQTLSEIDIVDEASFKLVHGGTMKATSARTTITKICKAGREYAIAEQKAWIAAERENIASFSAQEATLKAKKDAWIAQKERIEREALEARERVIRARFTALEGFGFTRRTAIDGGEDLYTNGDTTLAIAYVTAATDEVWNNVLKGIEMAWHEEQDRLKAAEEAREAEAERIRLAQEAIERQQRELKEQQDAFNARINEARKNELLAMGCEVDANGDAFVFIPKHISPLRPDTSSRTTWVTAELHLAPEWPRELDRAKGEIETRNARIKENEEFVARQALVAERVNTLKMAGWVEAELDGEDALALFVDNDIPYKCVAIATLHEEKDYIFNEWVDRGGMELARRKKVEEERIAAEAVEAARKRQEEEATRRAAEEQERKAKLSDVERWDAWMTDIEKAAPTLVSAQGQHAVTHLLAYIKDKYAPSVRNELKK